MTTPIRADVIDELVALRSSAKMAAETYSEAITNQSELNGVRKGALRRYINAKEAGRLAELDTEASDIANLLESAQ